VRLQPVLEPPPWRLHETCIPDKRFCTRSARHRADDVVVDIETDQGALLLTGMHRHRKPTLEDRLIARALAPWLDDELARGMQTSLSEAHTARAEQLAGERARRAVVRRLDRLVARAQHQRPPSRITPVAPCREQVCDAMPLILAIRSRLVSGEPLAAQGIARLKTLLSDRRGPCYVSTGAHSLTVALQEIAELLHAEETNRGDFEAE
jgi:hypothetical protein